MNPSYTTPLARVAKILEIIVPTYMFGKSWGIADEHTVDLFRAEFPALIIDLTEGLKGLLPTNNAYLQRLVATSAGAVVGFLVVAILAVLIHLVLRDRKYIDSLRFTSVCIIPLAVLNGTLSHVVKTMFERLELQSAESLTQGILQTPWSYFVLNFLFFMTALWMMGRRTGVHVNRRWVLVLLGTGFVALYLAAGLMIMPAEWEQLLPKLQQIKGSM